MRNGKGLRNFPCVIKTTGWIINLGPEDNGSIIATGTPEQLAWAGQKNPGVAPGLIPMPGSIGGGNHATQ